jgi:hypothetical protein
VLQVRRSDRVGGAAFGEQPQQVVDVRGLHLDGGRLLGTVWQTLLVGLQKFLQRNVLLRWLVTVDLAVAKDELAGFGFGRNLQTTLVEQPKRVLDSAED